MGEGEWSGFGAIKGLQEHRAPQRINRAEFVGSYCAFLLFPAMINSGFAPNSGCAVIRAKARLAQQSVIGDRCPTVKREYQLLDRGRRYCSDTDLTTANQ